MNKVEMEIIKYRKLFRIKEPKHWVRCEECGDFFKNEKMYRQRGWNYGGYAYDWYCPSCYNVTIDKKVEANGEGR